jgi:restriction system protein
MIAKHARWRGAAHQTYRSDETDQSDHAAYAQWLDHANSVVVANAIICLIHQTNYLLDQQIRALERDFIHEGGYSEQLAAARIQHRQQQNRTERTERTDQPDKSDAKPPSPACPLCGKPLALRTARQGPRAGSQFWGCTGYPECKGTQPV